MSQATRAIALQEAVKCFTKDGNADNAEQVLEHAGKFQTWLEADTPAPGDTGEATTPAATGAKRGRPSNASKQAAANAAATEPDGTEASPDDLKRQVGETLSKAIKADREAAVAVLAKFGAQSLSTIKAKDYAKVLEKLTALLPDPALE